MQARTSRTLRATRSPSPGGPGVSPESEGRRFCRTLGVASESMSLPLPSTLSPSKISAFKSCPLQFRFSVIDRLPEPPSPPASKGTLVHRALELLMLRPPADRTPATALAGLERARAELADHPEFAGLELGAEELDAFHADARALVLRYFEIEDPATVRPIGLELRLSVPVGSLTLRGVIDRLELDGDG